MKRRSSQWGLIAFSIMMFGNVAVGHATANLTVTRSGNGQYVVQGTGFEGVAGAEVVIQYDKTALANPRVVQGGLVSGSLMVTNTSEAGVVRLAGINAYPQTKSGTVAIATITFDATGSSPGSVTVTKDSKIVSVSGSPMPLVVVPFTDSADSGGTPPPGASNISGGSTTTTGGTASTAGGGTVYPTWLGGVSMPDEGARVEAKVRNEASEANPAAEKPKEKNADAAGNANTPSAVAQVSPPATSAETKVTQDGSVLEQFRLFQGEKTPKALVALFTRAMEGSRQTPPVVLSDGKTSVTVSVDISPAGKNAPNFALKGAKIVSLKKTGDTTWTIEALPTKGTFEATISILHDGAIKRVPLTVAPPLAAGVGIGTGGKLTEADFSLFLKERGTDKAPRFDVNGDGKRDYIDDYIFTANFLAKP